MRFRYTDEMVAFLRHLRWMTRADLTVAFNERFDTDRTEEQIRSTCKRLGILTGRTGHFRKGVPSWSKGKKGIHTGNRTSFQKGHRPHNRVPVGSEALTTDDRYVKVKIAEPNVWAFKHKLVWEQHNGPIPDGHAVIFRDNNRENCAIENLMLVTRQELLYMNQQRLIALPAEQMDSVHAIAQVATKAFALSKDTRE